MNRQQKHRFGRNDRGGIILLVVLSSLTFFSLLVAAYLVFSSQSRQSSFILASRTNHQPDINSLMNESLMLLIRGTSDGENPFYGESLLDDYYGRDGSDLKVNDLPSLSRSAAYLGRGIVRLPLVTAVGGNQVFSYDADDIFAGRIITFTDGPLSNRTYRILRSTAVRTAPSFYYDNVYFELTPRDLATLPSTTAFWSLFYETVVNSTTAPSGGYTCRLNGVPLNSPGVGYNGTNINDLINFGGTMPLLQRDPSDTTTTPAAVGIPTLPVALQPNHIRLPAGSIVNKAATRGDFDESYDAADFNNWFLSYRHSDGKVIPSFHRPSVVNYILNETDWSGAGTSEFTDGLVSIARSTFRPIPIAENQFAANSKPINAGFTGGNNSFALRTPLRLQAANGPSRLNQLAKALIEGPWDVDNDSDGILDSIWIDMGLPLITSPEGKLLRPMIAPMIEDLSGRLNLNAIGNSELVSRPAGLRSQQALWAGTTDTFGAAMNQRRVFRGIGYGPADIMIPASYSYTRTSPAGPPGLIPAGSSILTQIATLLNDRYRYGVQAAASPNPELPGRDDADGLDVLRTGWRPAAHTTFGGYKNSMDPFGRGGVALGRSGNVVASDSGRIISFDDPMTLPVEPTIDEAVNDPYEFNPRGELSGDSPFTLAELESILRSNDFDSEFLPQGLRDRVLQLIREYPEYQRSFTTLSVSDDAPAVFDPASETAFTALIDLIAPTGSTITNAQLQELIAPELRLGRKVDINRPFGNGIDDNGNGVVDEPGEMLRADNTGRDDDGDGTTDENGELSVEQQSFASVAAVPSTFQDQVPHYVFDEPPLAATIIPAGDSFQWDQVTGRQLLARHLYVLMMAMTEDGVAFPSVTGTFSDPADAALYRARRIAQWAVNVVDYRDSDSIMTRFVFDEDPFDGAAPPVLDGSAPPPEPAPASNVVWGVESPELIFSESHAFHDLRIRDTDTEVAGPSGRLTSSEMDGIMDSDSLRIPQGSLFLELYCPRSGRIGNASSLEGLPAELFDTATGDLDLDRRAPVAVGQQVGAPVWRIVITKPHYAFDPADPDTAVDPTILRAGRPDSYSFEPNEPFEFTSAAGDPASPSPIDRIVLFQNFTAIMDPSPPSATPENFVEYTTQAMSNAMVTFDPSQVFFFPRRSMASPLVLPASLLTNTWCLLLAPIPILVLVFTTTRTAYTAIRMTCRSELALNVL